MAYYPENIQTDDFDIYNSQGVPEALPGTPDIDENGHLIIPDQPYFSPAVGTNPSVMDPDPRNTGPTTDFWTQFPITIDINGDLYYYNENTGINIRGPEGAPRYVRYTDLTPEDIEALRGRDGADGQDGVDGRDGVDGQDGLDAYHAWLRDNGWVEQDHPISEFYSYLSTFAETLIKAGTGDGSIIANYGGEQNEANGEGSFAMGYKTTANGNHSFVAGSNTVAEANDQTVIGKYNLNNTNNAFEVGGGTVSLRKNLLSLGWNGTLTVSNEIIDGNNNKLSDKVDKEIGKGLSTNDFTDNYKNFIDSYHIDTEINQNSTNPVQNSTIYTALQNITAIAQKPTIEVETDDTYYSLISYKSINSSGKLDIGAVISNVQYNPNRNNLSIGANNSINPIVSNSITLGTELISNASGQTILGKYNLANADDVFQIGDGASSSARHNLLRVDYNGNLIIKGEFTNGSGVSLSDKQDILEFDNTPTQNSTKMVNSGTVYTSIQEVMTYYGNDITAIRNQITSLSSSISSLSAQIQALAASLYYMEDDTTGNLYKIGINNDQFYIQNQEDIPEDDDNEEEEEDPEV